MERRRRDDDRDVVAAPFLGEVVLLVLLFAEVGVPVSASGAWPSPPEERVRRRLGAVMFVVGVAGTFASSVFLGVAVPRLAFLLEVGM